MAPTVDTWISTTTHRPVMPPLTNLWLCSIGQSLIASQDLLKSNAILVPFQHDELTVVWTVVMLIMGGSTKNVHCDRIATTDYPAPTKPGPINRS